MFLLLQGTPADIKPSTVRTDNSYADLDEQVKILRICLVHINEANYSQVVCFLKFFLCAIFLSSLLFGRGSFDSVNYWWVVQELPWKFLFQLQRVELESFT